jgi:hypothetical protein
VQNPDEYPSHDGRMTNLVTGPEDCKSRMLGSKANTLAATDSDELESDSEDKNPATRSDSLIVDKQKKIISAVLSHFHASG